MENRMIVPQKKLKIELSNDPTILLLGIYPKIIEIRISKKKKKKTFSSQQHYSQ